MKKLSALLALLFVLSCGVGVFAQDNRDRHDQDRHGDRAGDQGRDRDGDRHGRRHRRHRHGRHRHNDNRQ